MSNKSNNEIDFEKIRWELRNRQYPYLGAGSSRRVYDLENGYVVKVAKNRGGMVQNQVEYYVYQKEQTALFAPILIKSEDNKYIIMKKAEKIWRIQYVTEYFKLESMTEFVNKPYIMELRNKYDLAKGDLVRKSSWGTINAVPVLIDYGYTVHGR